MPSANQDPLGLVGRTVDKYDIVALAGEGGFSVVYRAEHRIWKQPVAIKFFTLLEEAKPELRERLLEDFVREGKLLSELSSRTAAILQARDIGRLERKGDRWIPYMVLEWLEGRSLESWLDELRRAAGPAFELAPAVRLLGPAAQALEVAHAQGIAHRDLKPANLMVLGDWREPNAMLKVLDFGIAKVMTEHAALQEQLQLTGAQLSAFTPGYGAPEQFTRSHGATGPWTDVYAMALILLELMRGGEPVLQGETVYEVGRASCSPDARPTPRRLGLAVSDEVEAVFERALALRPSDRFPTMGQFWAELKAVSDWPQPRSSAERLEPSGRGLTEPMATGSVARATGPALSARSVVTPDGPTVAAMLTSVPSVPPSPPSRGRTWLPIAGALAAAAIIGVVAFSSTGSKPGEPLPASEAGPAPLAATAPTAEPGRATASTSAVAEPATATLSRQDAGPPTSTTATGPARGSGQGAAQGSASAVSSAAPPARSTASSSAAQVDPWDPSSFGGRR